MWKYLNMTLHRFATNLTSQSDIIAFDRSHFSKFNLVSSCTAQFLSPHMILSEINVMSLLNLSVTDMTLSKPSIDIRSLKMKLKIIVWKD